jgi:hypothetical protein
LPARHAFFAAATARRVVRSEPANPIAASLSCATSARMRPCDRSTHSSILSRNGSIAIARRHRSPGTIPASRSAT